MTENAKRAREDLDVLREQARRLLGQLERDVADMSAEDVQSQLSALSETRREPADGKARFRLLTDTIQDVFWMSTPGVAEQLYVSPAYETIWGRSLEELRQNPRAFLDSVHPEDREELIAAIEEHHAHGKPYTCEYRIIKPDGAVRWILERGFPVPNGRGDVELMTGVCTDVTEQKRLEAALRKSEARLRATVESLPFDFFAIGEDGRYVMQNSACAEHWGYFVGQRPGETAPDEETLNLWESNNRRAWAGEVVDSDIVVRHGGKTGYYRNIISPIRDGDEITGIIGVNIDSTAQKQAEQALRESEKRARENLAELELLYRTAPIGLCLIDTDLRYVRVNDELAAMNGRTVSEHIGRPIREVIPEIGEIAEAICRKVIETGEPELNVEFRGATPAHPGLQRAWLVSEYPLKDHDNAVIGISVVVREITELKEAEEALRASEEQYRGIFEATTNGAAILDPEGRLVEVNPAFCRMHGYTRAELLEMPPFDFIHPGSHSLFEEFIRVILEGRRFHCEAKDLRKDGTPFDIEVNGIPFNYGGRPHLLAVVRDISEQKRAEEALRESEERFRRIFETEPECIKLLDAEGNLLDMNPAGLSTIEAESLDEVCGKCIHPMIVSEYRDEFIAATEAVFRGEPRELQFEIVGLKGARRVMESHMVPVRNARGDIWALLAATRDITDRKRAEEERQAARQSLLEHQRLQREQVEAELAKVRDELVQSTALATVGKMSAQIAHDIRNPLGAILNTTGFLKRTIPLEQTKWHDGLDLIAEEVLVCNRILRNLLDITRTREPEKETIDFGRLLHQTAGRLNWPLGVRLQFASDPDPFLIEVDRVQLRQVLDNLLTNALDAIGDEGEITLNAVRSTDCDTITIADSGPGIPQEHRESLFELFFTTKANGTGLGLAICRRIIERHGGSIKLDDDAGQATTFRIRLPRTDE